MQTIDIMSSPALDPAKDNWSFLEVWVDPMQSPPYLLMLTGDTKGIFQIFDPVENYKVVLTSHSYEEAKLWLLEDEFEPIKGKLYSAEVLEGL